MKTKTLYLLVITMSLSIAVYAQDSRFSFELNTGASYATSSPGNADLNIGAGFETIFHYRMMPHVELLGGWGWNKFSANRSFAGNNMDFEETGYIIGLQFKHPLPITNLQYYIRANALYNHIELEDADGDIIEDTGHGFGWQLAGGLAIPISNRWTLTPGVKFNALSRDLETDTYDLELDQNYISMRLGFVYNF